MVLESIWAKQMDINGLLCLVEMNGAAWMMKVAYKCGIGGGWGHNLLTPIYCHEKPFSNYIFHVNNIYINSAKLKCNAIVIILWDLSISIKLFQTFPFFSFISKNSCNVSLFNVISFVFEDMHQYEILNFHQDHQIFFLISHDSCKYKLSSIFGINSNKHLAIYCFGN